MFFYMETAPGVRIPCPMVYLVHECFVNTAYHMTHGPGIVVDAYDIQSFDVDGETWTHVDSAIERASGG